VALVQHDNRAWPDSSHDRRSDPSGVAPNGVEPATAPTHEDESTPLEFGVKKEVLESDRRAEISRGPIAPRAQMLAAPVNLTEGPDRAGGPETPARMGVSMVRNLVAPGKDFRHQMRMFFRLLPDDEKSRARFESVEQIEDSAGVDR